MRKATTFVIAHSVTSALYGALVFAAYHWVWAYANQAGAFTGWLPWLNWMTVSVGVGALVALWQRVPPHNLESHYFKFNSLKAGLFIIGTGVVLWWGKGYVYSFVAFSFLGLVLTIDDVLHTHLTSDSRFWQLVGLMLIPALALTFSLPYALGETYHYAPRTGIEFGHVPLENLLLALSFLMLPLVLFQALKRRQQARGETTPRT